VASKAGPLDSLRILALAGSLIAAAVLFVVAVVSGVSVEGAAGRALVSWLVLAPILVGAAAVARWLLFVPARSASRFDITIGERESR